MCLIMSTENDLCTPPDLRSVAATTVENLLPKESKDLYNAMYKSFTEWRSKNNAEIISENILIAFFSELSLKYSPPTLWTKYSFLTATIELYDNINIKTFSKLLTFLKQNGVNYKPSKAKPLTEENVKDFIESASEDYFLTKVALIFALFGALRIDELTKIEYKNVDDIPNKKTFLVKVLNTKTHIDKSFTIKDEYYDMVKRYLALRPAHVVTPRLFLNYQQGKCTIQPVGKNKFSAMPRQIANFLNLSEPEKYTGHLFRRTSATIVANAGANTSTLKLHGGWKSSDTAQSYVDSSLHSKNTIANMICSSINVNKNQIRPSPEKRIARLDDFEPRPSTSTATDYVEISQNSQQPLKKRFKFVPKKRMFSQPPPILLSPPPPLPDNEINNTESVSQNMTNLEDFIVEDLITDPPMRVRTSSEVNS